MKNAKSMVGQLGSTFVLTTDLPCCRMNASNLSHPCSPSAPVSINGINYDYNLDIIFKNQVTIDSVIASLHLLQAFLVCDYRAATHGCHPNGL
jgi:hypothetical protein